MKAILTSAVLLLFALSTAVSAGEQADKKAEKKVIRKTVRVDQKGEGQGAWLGVALSDISTTTEGEGESKSEKKGAVVEEVMDESPADSAGLKADDKIVEINGKAVTKSEDVVKQIGAMKPGEKAAVVVLRGDAKKSFTVVLGSQPKMQRRMGMRGPGMEGGMPPGHPFPPMMMMQHRAGVEGMKLMPLTDQLGRYFEAPDGKALLVTEVKKNSNARKAGIEAGDVITKVGTTDIEDMGDLHQALKGAKEGSTVDVEIIRKGAHKTVKLEVSKQDEEIGMMHFDGDLPNLEDLHFDLGNFNFNREQFRDIMRDLKPQLDKIKPELDRIRKEIRIRMRGQEVNEPSAPEDVPEPDSDL